MMETLNKENIELTDKEMNNVNGGIRLNLYGGRQNDNRKPVPAAGAAPKPLKHTITTCPQCHMYKEMTVSDNGTLQCSCGNSWTAFV